MSAADPRDDVVTPPGGLDPSGVESLESDDPAAGHGDGDEGGHGGHSKWMMVACCVPMLAIAVLIALSGAGFGFLIVAIGCTLMMVLMMGAMTGGGGS